MDKPIQLILGDDAVNFTEDGKVSVLDAISALSDTDCVACIWDEIKSKNPQLREYYQERRIQGGHKEPVVDSKGWEILQELLFDYMLERDD
jgi:hypothetical protein